MRGASIFPCDRANPGKRPTQFGPARTTAAVSMENVKIASSPITLRRREAATPETKVTGLERPPAIGHEHRWTVGVAAPDGG